MPFHSPWSEALFSFASVYLTYFAGHALLVGVLVLIFGTLFGGLGRGFGLQHLFWNERPFAQGVAGAACAVLVGYVFLAGYVVDADFIDTAWTGRFPAPWRSLCFISGGVAWCAALVPILLGLQHLLHSLSRMVTPGRTRIATALRERRDRSARLRSPPRRSPMVIGWAIGLAILGAFVWFLSSSAYARQAPLLLCCTMAILLGVVYAFRRLVNPAAAVCLLLGLVVTLDVASFELDRSGTPRTFVVAGLALLVLVAGIPVYRLRFPKLDGMAASLYGAPLPLAGYDALPPHPAVLPATELPSADGGRRPLVLVCVSGGGLRAAVWTTAVLMEIEHSWDDFPYHVRIIAGASGGMVGAAQWVSSLESPTHSSRGLRHGPHSKKLVEQVGEDALSDVARALVLRDIPLAFLPIVNRRDRGVRLEEAWAKNMGAAMKKTFAELRVGEEEGWRPSLVFSPMLVEDGRRLLVSNLDLRTVTINHGWMLAAGKRALSSQSALELSRMFPAQFDALPVSTAARMSATFPYVTPASSLPTSPRRRVVDAGYYDDYGVNVVCGWLDEVLAGPDRTKLAEKFSCILVVQIRDGESDLSAPEAAAWSPRDASSLARGLDGLVGPIAAVLAARESVPVFRNDEQLEALSDQFNAEHGDGFFQIATFTYLGDASLSWCLTEQERQDLRDKAKNQVDRVREKLVRIAGRSKAPDAAPRRASSGKMRAPFASERPPSVPT